MKMQSSPVVDWQHSLGVPQLVTLCCLELVPVLLHDLDQDGRWMDGNSS